jgi:WD40 repeat protein
MSGAAAHGIALAPPPGAGPTDCDSITVAPATHSGGTTAAVSYNSSPPPTLTLKHSCSTPDHHAVVTSVCVSPYDSRIKISSSDSNNPNTNIIVWYRNHNIQRPTITTLASSTSIPSSSTTGGNTEVAAATATATAAADSPIPTLESDGHHAGVTQVCFNPDGTQFASASLDGTIRIWQMHHTESTHDRFHFKCIHILDPDSRRLASTLSRREVIYSVDWSQDGRWLAASCRTRAIVVWRCRDWKVYGSLKRPMKRSASRILFSPDSQLCATTSFGWGDTAIHVWQCHRSWKSQILLKGHRASVEGLAFTSNSLLLASSSRDATVRVWDCKTLECVHTIELDGTGWSKDISFHPDNTYLAVDTGIYLQLWSCDTWECMVQVPQAHTCAVTGIVFNRHGDELITCSNDSRIQTWDVDLNRRRVACIYPPLNKKLWPVKCKPHLSCALIDTFFASDLCDVNVLRRVREYL